MAELNLKQITDKLNSEFTGEVRKLVFWYDANAEFIDDVDTMDLVNAKVLHLEPDNQFYIKYFLECEDTMTNYLVYAPFDKPSIRENHLADTIRYSKEFYADRASLLTVDLGIDERYKSVIQHYIKFFGERKRTQAFYDLEIEIFNRNTIEIALMSVLCKCKTSSFEEVFRVVLTEGGLEDNSYLKEFKKYDLLDAFWRLVSETFGYAEAEPTMEKMIISMFIIYLKRTLECELPTSWDNYAKNMVVGYTIPLDEIEKHPEKEKKYRVYKSGNCMSFIDDLMNSYIYSDRFDEISKIVYDGIKADAEFKKMPLDAIISCKIFAGIDELVLAWIVERLELEDVSAKIGNVTIPEIVKQRRQTHFGKNYRTDYFILQNAWNIISNSRYVSSSSLGDMVKRYTNELYNIDRYYRYFYYYMDLLEDSSKYETLKELIENIYANDYLAKLCTNWNEFDFVELDSMQIVKQSTFFSRNISYAKEQLIVIISDALRYEVGISLLEKLKSDERCTVSMKEMIAVLPSITEYGMAALLPHKEIQVVDDFSVRVDGQKCDTLEQRQAILQKNKSDALCVQYDDLKNMSVTEMKSFFARKPVVYIYHNQIDARGDNAKTENEIFSACEEAINEIYALIRKMTSANKTNYIITSDHGFMYRRRKLSESDKIGSLGEVAHRAGRRYLVSKDALVTEGVSNTDINVLTQSDSEYKVSYPIGADVFKVSGTGMNYVHGGCSPQEMILPLIEVKTERGHIETSTVEVALVSLVSKITNLITTLDFVQKDAISDAIKETTYRIYFVDDKGEKISNEHLYVADKKDVDTVKRVFRLRFSLKNRKYEPKQKYYLVAYDEKNSLEVIRHEVQMDIAFADDFGF